MFRPDFLMKNIYDIDADFIGKNGIKGIIFDIDNTLVGFTEKHPSDSLRDFINLLKSQGVSVSVASNNSKARVSEFCQTLDVKYISRACKPLPFALWRLSRSMGVKRKNTAVVGDQIFTDTLGANLAGMISVVVDIIDTKETRLFKIKRALEMPIIESKRRRDKKNNG